MMRRLLLPAVFLLLAVPAHGQLHFSLYTSSMYDDNSFAFYEKREDMYHSLFGALSTGGNLGEYTYMQGYYYGALVLFRTYSERTYNIHTLGAYTQVQLNYRSGDDDQQAALFSQAAPFSQAALFPKGPRPSGYPEETEQFSDSLVSYLFIIPQIGARFDHRVWDFYDFQRGSILLRLRQHITGRLMGMLHLGGQYKRYPNLEQFTHVEQTAGVVLSHPLVRDIEMFAALDAGRKDYTETVSDTLWVTDGKPGKGKGGVKPPRAVISRFSTPATTQFVISAGLLYRLFPQAPLSLSYLRRSNPSSDARYISENAVLGLSEDEIFDDRYGYQSHELRLQLDGQLPGGIRCIGGLHYLDKDYPRTATDLAGTPRPGYPQRRDERFALQLQALYPLFRADDGTGLSVGLAYNYLRNRSNNAYHDYHIHQVAFVMAGDW